jgi:hypothetical protein
MEIHRHDLQVFLIYTPSCSIRSEFFVNTAVKYASRAARSLIVKNLRAEQTLPCKRKAGKKNIIPA